MQCSNNLKQIALAAHTYHDAHKTLPAAVNELPGIDTAKIAKAAISKWSGGVFVAILPFLEQSALYSETQTTTYPTRDIYDIRPKNWPIAATDPICWLQRIPGLLCPSDNGRSVPANLYAPTNYLASSGDWADYGRDVLEYLDATTASPLNTRGPFPAYPEGALGFDVIGDGLSNTLAFSERLIGRAGNVYDAKVGIISRTAFQLNLLKETPANILAQAPGGQFPTSLAFTPSADGGGVNGTDRLNDDGGAYWGAGAGFTRYNLFSAILPPNSPAASHQNPNGRHLVPPSSHHGNGVLASRLDGSVLFIPEGIDCGNSFAKQLKENTGISLYGVWGAFGSISHGEATSGDF